MSGCSGRFRKKRTNFSMVSNTLIHDESISLKAKGLYTLIQSYVTLDNFTLYKGFLMSRCCEGRKAFDSAWNELKKAGYLIQYRMKDDKNQFYYEYELLDAPISAEKTEPISPMSQKGAAENTEFPGVPKGAIRERCSTGNEAAQNGGDINNTIQNNIIPNNTYPSYLSDTDNLMDIKTVQEQIEYEYFEPWEQIRVNEFAYLILEVYRIPDQQILRIGQMDIPALYVKERFRMLNSTHIRYLLKSLNSTGRIKNIKSYLLTSLFNAPITIQSYYQNLTK